MTARIKEIGFRVGTVVLLKDLVDVNLLVNRHEVKKRTGVRVEDIPVQAASSPHSQAAWVVGQGKTAKILIRIDVLDAALDDPEAFYVLLAHELTHIYHPFRGKAVEHLFPHAAAHGDQPGEQEANYWAGLQAARFGWTRGRVMTFVQGVYKGERKISVSEEDKREFASFLPPLTRRPRRAIRVRTHRRTR